MGGFYLNKIIIETNLVTSIVWSILKMKFCTVILALAFIGLSCAAETKSPCQGCKDLVDGILKGLDQTKNKNFGGGDTAWEEKKNLKYKVSETRLVEVLESACAKDNFRCNELASEREDDIETWYKTMQDDKPLHEFLCIEKAQACCAEGKFGENCEGECPANSNGDICFGNGKCDGSGDKQGSGTCVCDKGYAGDLCNECGSGHFKSFSNDTYTMCAETEAEIEKEQTEDTSPQHTSALETEEEEEEEGLEAEDVRKLVAAVLICIIGTAAANGNIFWNFMFFISIFTAIYYWAVENDGIAPASYYHTHTEL